MLIYLYDKQFDICMLRSATILKKPIFDPTCPAFPYNYIIYYISVLLVLILIANTNTNTNCQLDKIIMIIDYLLFNL